MNEVLPQNWVSAEIGWICHLVNGKAFKPSDWVDQGIPIVRIQNLNNPEASFNYFNGEVSDKYLIDSGALLFAWSGTPGTSFGAHIWTGGPAVLNQHIYKVEVDEKRISRSYLRFAINQELHELIGKAHGGAGLRHVTKGTFEKTKISLPPTNEQHRIVETLDALLERSRRVREALLAISVRLDQYCQSVLLAAFQGELTAEWRESRETTVPFERVVSHLHSRRNKSVDAASDALPRTTSYAATKERPLELLPASWSFTRLENLASSVTYGSSKKSNPLGQIPVLRMGNIQNGNLDWSDLVYTSDPDEIRKYSLAFGDVLFNRTNSPELVGKTAVFLSTRPAIYAGYLIRIQTSERLHPEFLAFFLNSPLGREYCRRVKSDGVSQSNINARKLAAFAVPFCSIEEQRLIVGRIKEIFSTIENVRGLVDDAIEKSEVIERSILAKAFRAELGSQDPADEPAHILLNRIREEGQNLRNAGRVENIEGGKRMARKKVQVEPISIVEALKRAPHPLSSQELLTQAGYPKDIATEELELFFLEVREHLENARITRVRIGYDDFFALAE